MKQIFRLLVISILFISSIYAINLGDDIEVDELHISGKNMDLIKKKAVKKALEKSLHLFGVKEGPIYDKFFSQYSKNKYVDEIEVNYKKKTSDGYKAVLSFSINGQEFYNTYSKAIKSVIRKEIGNAKFVVAFLMKSDINLYDKKSARKIADQNNKTLNASVIETLRTLKIKIKDNDRIRTIINDITSQSTKLSTAQTVNNLRDDVKAIAKKKRIPYAITGVVNIINKKEKRGKVILTVAVSGTLIDIKNNNIIPYTDTIKIIDRTLSDAIIAASQLAAKDVLIKKGLVTFLNSFQEEIEAKRVGFYICNSQEYEDDFDDFKDDVLGYIEDNFGKIIDEDEVDDAYSKVTVNVDFGSVAGASNVRHLKKLLKKGLGDDYDTIYVQAKKDNIGISMIKKERCLKKYVKSNSKSEILKTVKATGYGDSIEYARKSALQAALEQVVGASITSSTLVKEGALESDDIHSTTAGLVKEYKVLKTKKDGKDDFEIKIKATINPNAVTPEGIKEFIKDRKSMRTFVTFNFKGQSIYINYLDKKSAKKMLGGDINNYVPKTSSAANIIKSKIRKVLRSKGFKIVDKKSKAQTVIYTYGSKEVQRDGNDYSASVRILITGKSKKGLYFADVDTEAQALSETKKDAILQATKKAGDIVSEKLLINIVKNFINQ